MMMRGWRACYKFLGGPICSFHLFLYFCICIFVFVFVFFVFPCIRGWVVGGGGMLISGWAHLFMPLFGSFEIH